MAEVVLGIGTSHSPMLNTEPESWLEHAKRDLANANLWAWDGMPHTYEEMLEMTDASIEKEITVDVWKERHNASQAAIAKLGEIIDDVNPDVLVIVGDDQKELIQETNMPALLVYWGDTLSNKPRDHSRMPPSIAMAAWGNEFGEEVVLPGQPIWGCTSSKASCTMSSTWRTPGCYPTAAARATPSASFIAACSTSGISRPCRSSRTRSTRRPRHCRSAAMPLAMRSGEPSILGRATPVWQSSHRVA